MREQPRTGFQVDVHHSIFVEAPIFALSRNRFMAIDVFDGAATPIKCWALLAATARAANQRCRGDLALPSAFRSLIPDAGIRVRSSGALSMST
jgi:hypothetical protein